LAKLLLSIVNYKYFWKHLFSGKQIVLRGCSSKRKMFHIQCESHLSGTRNEKFCYCGYDLCNAATSEQVNGKTSVAVILLSVMSLIHL
jgi:hypothetical protein